VSISKSQWIEINTGHPNGNSGVYFINTETGFVAGDGGTYIRRILKTTNGGNNWIIKHLSSGTVLSKIQFVNNNTGYVVTSLAIVKTINGGENWNVISNPYILSGLFFNDANTGYFTGRQTTTDKGIIIKTTNGGSTWALQYTSDSTCFLNDVLFVNYNTGFAAGSTIEGFAKILKTTNGGNNWSLIYGGAGTSGTYNIHFTGPDNGFASGSSGKVISTTNAGINWYEQFLGTTNALSGLTFTTPSNGYSISLSGHIFKTTNAGINWSLQQLFEPSLSDIFFVNTSTGFIVGSSGKMYKTTNGGSPTGIEHISNKLPNKYSLYQNYPNPFNPNTIIKFDAAQNSLVVLKIFDISGREVKTLVNGFLKAGTYKIEFDASSLSSGIYYYRLISENYSETKKMIFIK